MSRWRREASERLPELQPIISAKHVDGPMMLWIELNMVFQAECEKEESSVDLLRRIWAYALWGLLQKNDDLSTAICLAFCEHLIDTPQRIALLPQIMTRQDLLDFNNFLEYFNSKEEIEAAIKAAWG